MKKSVFILTLLSSFLMLSACNSGSQQSSTPSGGGGGGGDNPPVEPGGETAEGKIKEIALRSSAKTSLRVTDRISTSVLYEIKANKGQTLKTADKKVIITSSNQEVLKVENTSATLSTFLQALKPGEVKLTIQSNVEQDKKLEIDMTVLDSAFDRMATDGFFGNYWDNCDFTHETDEEEPYIKTVAEEEINHQFYFRDSYSSRCYVESEFTFYSEADGTAHMPKLGFVFSTNETNDTNGQSVSFIYFDTDCRGGNDTFYNIGYNEIDNGLWGWDVGGSTLAKSFGLYRYEPGVKIGEKFKIGVVKEGYNYHIYFNDVYTKSVETTKEGFSTDKTYTEAAPTICGLFDFKSEVKYSSYSFSTDEELIASKIPQEPDFTTINGASTKE